MGLHGMPSCDLIFEDCLVPKENLVIPEGGFAKLMQAFDVERCGNATQSLGIAWGALEAAKKYSQERTAFGKPICEFQAIQFLLADMAMKVEAARLLIYRAASMPAIGLAFGIRIIRGQMLRQRNGQGGHRHGACRSSAVTAIRRNIRLNGCCGTAAAGLLPEAQCRCSG